jgi:hypothetical protein
VTRRCQVSDKEMFLILSKIWFDADLEININVIMIRKFKKINYFQIICKIWCSLSHTHIGCRKLSDTMKKYRDERKD